MTREYPVGHLRRRASRAAQSATPAARWPTGPVYSHPTSLLSTECFVSWWPAMAADVVTTVTELPESRVRVQAEVRAEEVERRVAQAAKRLGRNLRVPGFRAGKAPPPVIVQRVGRDAVLDEAVRES